MADCENCETVKELNDKILVLKKELNAFKLTKKVKRIQEKQPDAPIARPKQYSGTKGKQIEASIAKPKQHRAKK